jgi:EAL domain-containing protein (putative c-di-GMP-specific phosphodiesterase class I)
MNYVTTQSNDGTAMVNPFQFAILLDEQGREIAITEEMIQKACADLAERCQFPSRQAA